tara:strand:- start:358 stop:2094 length:1737 start_codon:yes stop_codon:yes gene_type:complete
MARQGINIGSSANDGTGDPLRTAFDKINDNFVELYGSDNDINTLDANLNLNNFAITTGVTNGDMTLTPNGTGSIFLGALEFNGTTISSQDSTQITIAENIQTTGTVNVSGATTLGSTLAVGTSLALATGATVTGIDNGSLGSSATLLATQGAIKTYVDAQVTAQDLDFACDDSTTLSIDLDSESLQFSGGTGITTAGTGNTVTVAIDSTVATLTGSQTLTNKTLTNPTINAATMTGAVAIDGVTIDDNKVTSNASDSNLELDASGSGSVRLVAPTTAVSTLTTADVTTVGTHTITGQLDAESVRIKDNTITTNATNANLELTANGTGVVDVKKAMTTIGQTITGNVVIDGQFDVDNISINGNGIIATNSGGGININPNATGQVTIGGTVVQVPGLLAATDMQVTSNLFLGQDALISTSVSNSDINIEANGTGSVYVDELRFKNNNITTHITNANLELTTDGTGTIELQTATNVTGNLTVSGAFIGSRQAISGAGAINLTTLFTELTTTGADAYSLANGTVGQVKIITMGVDGGNATITPTTFANGTSITMDAVHDSVTLIYGANGWVVLASQNITINA